MFVQCFFKLLALLVLGDCPMGALGLLDELPGYLCKLLSCWTSMLSRHGMNVQSLLGPSSILSVPELQIPFVLGHKGGENAMCSLEMPPYGKG